MSWTSGLSRPFVAYAKPAMRALDVDGIKRSWAMAQGWRQLARRRRTTNLPLLENSSAISNRARFFRIMALVSICVAVVSLWHVNHTGPSILSGFFFLVLSVYFMLCSVLAAKAHLARHQTGG